jgi:hypothetical protein
MIVLETTRPTWPSPKTAAEISPLDPGNRISVASSAVMQPSRLLGLGLALDVLAAAAPGSSSLPPQLVKARASTPRTAKRHSALARLAARTLTTPAGQR